MKTVTKETEDDKSLLEHEECEIESLNLFIQPTTQRDARSLALQFLYLLDRSDYDQPFDAIFERICNAYDLSLSQESITYQSAHGVVMMSDELDATITNNLHNWSFDRISCCTKLILKLATWEFLKTDTPPTIIINEAVELSKLFAEHDSYRLINGVLDQIVSQLNKEKKPDLEK